MKKIDQLTLSSRFCINKEIDRVPVEDSKGSIRVMLCLTRTYKQRLQEGLLESHIQVFLHALNESVTSVSGYPGFNKNLANDSLTSLLETHLL